MVDDTQGFNRESQAQEPEAGNLSTVFPASHTAPSRGPVFSAGQRLRPSSLLPTAATQNMKQRADTKNTLSWQKTMPGCQLDARSL
ncbi:hypothetical protein VTN00DRAFT_5548 [Thermoascus crustaceus]|uniref:uncharacterized protein n=1 Tax=Thermoascus crustaceus TaxID=5088 RepID=UPI0037447D7E